MSLCWWLRDARDINISIFISLHLLLEFAFKESVLKFDFIELEIREHKLKENSLYFTTITAVSPATNKIVKFPR